MVRRGWFFALVIALPLLIASAGCSKVGGGAAKAVGAGGNSGGEGGTVVVIPIPERWVDEALSRIVAWVEDGTGIEIEKGDVKIESLGARKEPGGYHISDFKITVHYRRTEFTSTPKDIPCSADGIPTEEGNQKIRDAVEEIKQNIRAAR